MHRERYGQAGKTSKRRKVEGDESEGNSKFELQTLTRQYSMSKDIPGDSDIIAALSGLGKNNCNLLLSGDLERLRGTALALPTTRPRRR